MLAHMCAKRAKCFIQPQWNEARNRQQREIGNKQGAIMTALTDESEEEMHRLGQESPLRSIKMKTMDTNKESEKNDQLF